jgi:hypothetical protein
MRHEAFFQNTDHIDDSKADSVEDKCVYEYIPIFHFNIVLH